MAWHDDSTKEWGALGARYLNPSDVYYKSQINTRIVQGAQREGETAEGGTVILREAQGGGINLQSSNREDNLVRRSGQVAVPA